MNDYPLGYLFICGKIRKMSRFRIVPYYLVKEALERNLINWSKEMKYQILKDMERYKILKKISNSANSSYEIYEDAEKKAKRLLRKINSSF